MAERRLGLVLEGGGMRAGFVAGVVMALMDMGLLARFDLAAAVSASIPTLAYAAAGQREEMESVWRRELNTPRLVCYKNIPATSLAPSSKRPVLDIDYLVFDVFKTKYPLDRDRLLRSSIRCGFAVTRAADAELVLLDPAAHDIYEVFKASLAVPGCYPEAVRLGGEEYLDGGTVNPLPVDFLLGRGMDLVVGVLSRPLDCENEPPNLLERALFWRYFQRYEWMMESLWGAAEKYNQEVSRLEEMAARTPPASLIIAPERMPPARFITRDRRKINRTIDMGYQRAEASAGDLRGILLPTAGDYV